MISGECGPLMDDAGNSTVLCRTENMVLYDENKKEIYLLQDDCLYFAAKLDLSVISGGAESIKSAPYIYKMTEDCIFGFGNGTYFSISGVLWLEEQKCTCI